MYTVYKCNGCNEERETPLGGCFALNPLGVAPKGCLYMDDCAGTWQKVSASKIKGTAPSASSNTASMPCLMYAGVNELCNVFSEGLCGSAPCNLARHT